jgi:hypothetical protein
MQVSLGGVNLEVATFKSGKKVKQRLYSRVRAFSDTIQIIGTFNTTYDLSIIVPQQFSVGEDVESTLFAMRGAIQTLVDVEGVNHSVAINDIGSTHAGGQPLLYTLDVTMTETDA